MVQINHGLAPGHAASRLPWAAARNIVTIRNISAPHEETSIAAYIIVELEITDPATYDEYKKLVPPTLAAYDGRFVVRGGACETLEGSWQPQRVVVLGFPSMACARQWWESEEYRTAKTMRQRAATTRMIVVEGAA